MIITERLEKFMEAYSAGLRKAIEDHPDDYPWTTTIPVETVLDRMRQAIRAGSFNHDGHGFKNACKILCIKHTRKSVINYIRGE